MLTLDVENVVNDVHPDLIRPVVLSVQADLKDAVVITDLDHGLVVLEDEVFGGLAAEERWKPHQTSWKQPQTGLYGVFGSIICCRFVGTFSWLILGGSLVGTLQILELLIKLVPELLRLLDHLAVQIGEAVPVGGKERVLPEEIPEGDWNVEVEVLALLVGRHP